MKTIEHWQKDPFHSLAPLRVLATAVSGCNLACDHCYWSHDIHQASIRDWTQTINKLKQIGVPLIYAGRVLNSIGANFLEEYSSEVGEKFGIIDNGTTILKHPDLLPKYDQISISIDGSRQQHDTQRRKPGTFDTAWRTVLELKRQGFDPVVSAALSATTIMDWDGFEALLAENDVPLSCTLVWSLPETIKRGASIVGDEQSLMIFERLLQGIPKLINLYSTQHIKAVASILKQFHWTVNEDCLTTETPSGVVIVYRPESVVGVTELDLRWDGKLYTSLSSGVPYEVEAIDECFWRFVNRSREKELLLWRNVMKGGE